MQDLIKKIKNSSQNLYDYAEALEANNKDFVALSQIFSLSEHLECLSRKVNIFTDNINETIHNIGQTYVLIVIEKDVIIFKEKDPKFHIPVLVSLVKFFISFIEKLLTQLKGYY